MRKIMYILLFSTLFFRAESQWTAFGSGMNGLVNAVCVYQGNLYATGQFTTAGGVSANYVAYWNGTSWNACGSGLAGGGFSGIPNGSALCVYNGNLIVGGQFATAGGIASQNIASWNGTTWSAFGSGGKYGAGTDNFWDAVYCMAVMGGNLYVGGTQVCGNYTAEDFVEWNGSSWIWPGTPSGYYGQVNAMCVNNAINTIYFGGGVSPFEPYYSPSYCNCIQSWNGSSYSFSPSIGNSSGNQINALCMWNGNVYAGGWFAVAGATTVNYVVEYSGGSLFAVGSGVGSGVTALLPYSSCGANLLVASGLFGSPSAYTAQWNGSSWTHLSGNPINELNNWPTSFCTYGNYLVAGGGFNATNDGTITLNFIGGLSCGVILPITLKSFTAECNNQTAFLQWTTGTETNNDYFTIERTQDGLNYETIGTMKGSGTTSTERYYTFTDESPLIGTTYYRLKQTDLDGHTAVTGEATFRPCEGNNTIKAFVTSNNSIELNVNSQAQDIYTVQLTSALGQTVYTTTKNINVGNTNLSLNPGISDGMYILTVTGKDVNFTKKMIFGRIVGY